jgi:hypothetical protein
MASIRKVVNLGSDKALQRDTSVAGQPQLPRAPERWRRARLSAVGQLIFAGLGLGQLPRRSLILGSHYVKGDALERDQAI